VCLTSVSLYISAGSNDVSISRASAYDTRSSNRGYSIHCYKHSQLTLDYTMLQGLSPGELMLLGLTLETLYTTLVTPEDGLISCNSLYSQL